ncbi:MAG: sulfatase-like hydrolase/transferase, partial [Planctomycetales bacterium]
LSNMDDGIGDVLQKLRDEGLEKNTIVFFLSDNGGPTRELTSSNRPLRGEKGGVYEGGLRVPMLIQWKGTLPAGNVYREPALSVDLFATAAAAAKATLPKNRTIDGVDLAPYLLGEKKGRPRASLFWRLGRRTAIRLGDWKLLRNPRRGSGDAWSLYHLTEDVSESNDLAATRPDKKRELLAAWESLNTQMIEPLWGGRK